MTDLSAYGSGYNPATHSWPTGVRPTGPECRVCKGRGSHKTNQERDPDTGAWNYDERECGSCRGTGVRPPAGVS